MPSNRQVERLRDSIRNCDSILGYVKGMDFDAYVADGKTRDAVERCFMRISKAAGKLGSYLDSLYPNTDWEGARGVGNILRHQYDRLDDGILWDGIITDVPRLRQSALAEIERLERPATLDGMQP